MRHRGREVLGIWAGVLLTTLFLVSGTAAAIDTDGDGMPDGFEVLHGLDPNTDDAAGDLDLDEATNLEEYLDGTSPSDDTSVPTPLNAYTISHSRWLHVVDLRSGARTLVAKIGAPGNFEGLAPSPFFPGELYTVETLSDSLYRVDVETGAATLVGPLGSDLSVRGLARSDSNGSLWMLSENDIYEIDAASGAATFLGTAINQQYPTHGLAVRGAGLISLFSGFHLYQIDTATGVGSLLYYLPQNVGGNATARLGLATDPLGYVWGLRGDNQTIFQIDVTAGTVFVRSTLDRSDLDWLAFDEPLDTDGDGMVNFWETLHGLDPNDPLDAAQDGDGDDLDNLEEYQVGTDPNQSDSDGDGLSDGAEVDTYGTKPLIPDSDGDGLSDGDEINLHSTNALHVDSDGDGMSDPYEVSSVFDPLVADSAGDLDADGWSNWFEYVEGTDPDDGASMPGPLEAYSVDSNFRLQRIDLRSGTTELIGPLGDQQIVTALAFDRSQILYKLSTFPFMGLTLPFYSPISVESGAATIPGELSGFASPMGWAFDDSEFLWIVELRYGAPALLRISKPLPPESEVFSGDVIAQLDLPEPIDCLAWHDSELYTVSSATDSLYKIDPTTGASTLVGPLGIDTSSFAGLTADRNGVLRGVDTDTGTLFAIDEQTGRAGIMATTLPGQFRALAIDSFLDADADDMADSWEIQFGLDPSNPLDAALDLEGDGLDNLAEFEARSDPSQSDSDGDGLSDAAEVEVYGTLPYRPDTDGDALLDSFEVTYGFDPLATGERFEDPDGDEFNNFEEQQAGTDPLDPNSVPVDLPVMDRLGQALIIGLLAALGLAHKRRETSPPSSTGP